MVLDRCKIAAALAYTVQNVSKHLYLRDAKSRPMCNKVITI